VCVCVFIYIYIYIYIYMHIYHNTQARVCAFLSLCVNVCVDFHNDSRD
jgi:hypothetical protein